MDFEAFDSLADLLAALRRRREAADARVLPWQAAITAGQYFRRPSSYGFAIYGEVVAEEEPRAQHLRHYRFCRCYSVACPEGEYGDVHVSTVEQLLSREAFLDARRRGWTP